MKRFLAALMVLAVLALPAVAGPQQRTSFCLNLFGSLVPAPRAVVVLPPYTDPGQLAMIQRIADQQADIKLQMQFDRQAQQAWQQQQMQLQILAGQQAQVLQAIDNGRVNTQETKDLLRQMCMGQAALMNAIQNAPPIVIQQGATTPMVPIAPAITVPPATTPPTTPPQQQSAIPPTTTPTTSYTTKSGVALQGCPCGPGCRCPSGPGCRCPSGVCPNCPTAAPRGWVYRR